MGSSETMEVRAAGSDVPPVTRLPTETRRMLTRPPNGATMRVNSKLSCADRMAVSAVSRAAAAARADPEAHWIQPVADSGEWCERIAYLPIPERKLRSHAARSPVATRFRMDAGLLQKVNRPYGQFGHPGNGFQSNSR